MEGAKSFYGSVFGWETLGLDGGFRRGRCPATPSTWSRTTPASASGWPRRARPRASRTSSPASIPIPDDQPDTPPHWGVTFAVDDADAIAAKKATELGGKVVLPPMDAPWVRLTVIADPQGATFTASKFVPENKDLADGADAEVSAAYVRHPRASTRSRWTFVNAARRRRQAARPPRGQHNPAHYAASRAHRDTLLDHLSDQDGKGRTV